MDSIESGIDAWFAQHRATRARPEVYAEVEARSDPRDGGARLRVGGCRSWCEETDRWRGRIEQVKSLSPARLPRVAMREEPNPDPPHRRRAMGASTRDRLAMKSWTAS